MQIKSNRIIGSKINLVTWSEGISIIQEWVDKKSSRYVCFCNVHSVVTAKFDQNFNKIINSSDLSAPDGAPVAWMLRKLGNKKQLRISGPDFMWKYFEEANKREEAIFLYGNLPETLNSLEMKIKQTFPKIRLAGAYSPPFRKLTDQEDNEVIKIINSSGAGTVWVSLGCPKQEYWIHEHKEKISAVMLGVGAAFDFHAGTLKRAPDFMQKNGLEWLHRLYCEPSRLWKRYLFTNFIFIFLALHQLINKRS